MTFKVACGPARPRIPDCKIRAIGFYQDHPGPKMLKVDGAQHGFVMSLYGRSIGAAGTANVPVGDVIAGNLCRCTGYGPILAAGEAVPATAEDDDTNVLQLGLNFDYFRDPESTVPFWITGDAGYIMDFVDNSRRIRLRSAIEPGFTGDLGICRLGSGKFAMSGKLAPGRSFRRTKRFHPR